MFRPNCGFYSVRISGFRGETRFVQKRSQAVLQFEKENIRRNSPAERQEKRIKDRELYYGKIMPFLYARFFGILGFLRKLIAVPVSFFRPMML